MNLTIEIIDFSATDQSQLFLSGWHTSITTKQDLAVRYSSHNSNTLDKLSMDNVICMALICDSASPEVNTCIEHFFKHVGPFAEFICVISDNLLPQAFVDFFEYGIETFFSSTSAILDLQNFALFAYSQAQAKDSELLLSLKLMKSIRENNKQELAQLSPIIEQMAEYNFRASYLSAKTCEAEGNAKGAITAYENGHRLNQMFRPISVNLAQSYQKSGDFAAAAKIFEELESTNPDNIKCKANLVEILMKSDRYPEAETKLVELKNIAPENKNLFVKLKAGLFLKRGEFDEALKILDTVQNVGDDFASALNDQAIALANSGQGKNALQLYDKAHQIVRKDLRYKISYNASLASMRLKEFEKALEFIDRCQVEYGKTFPKALAIKVKIIDEKAKHMTAKVS